MRRNDDQATDSRARWTAVLPELVTLALCAFLYTQTMDLRGTNQGPGPAAYPRILIILLAVAMLVRLGQHLRALRSGAASDQEAEVVEEGAELDPSLVSNVRVWLSIAMAVGYVLASIYVGWVIATFVFVPVFLYAAGRRRLLLTIPLGAALAIGSAYVFVKIVYIALPTGVGIFDELTVRLFIFLGVY